MMSKVLGTPVPHSIDYMAGYSKILLLNCPDLILYPCFFPQANQAALSQWNPSRWPQLLSLAPPCPAILTGVLSLEPLLAGGTQFKISVLGINSRKLIPGSILICEGFVFFSKQSHSQFKVIHCFLVLKDWKCRSAANNYCSLSTMC
jgi:hypothetical protein